MFSTQGTFDRIKLQLEYLWSHKMINCLFGQVLLCFDLPQAPETSSTQKSSKDKKNYDDRESGLTAELMQSKRMV